MKSPKPISKASSACLDSSAWSKVKSIIDNAVSYFNATHFHPFTKEEVEDICQDIIIRVMERFDQFNPSKSSLSTWISRVTHNYCVDVLKATPAVSFVPFDDVMNYSLRTSSSPEEEYVEMERLEFENKRHQWLNRSINSLKPRERKIMRLTLVGRKPRDIAQILNATPNSIRIAKFNAQRTLCDMARL